MTEPVLFAEPGSSWWPVLFGPAFALAGGLAEWATGPVSVPLWVLVGLVLAAATAVWVYARRGVCSVSLTPGELRAGRETLAVQRIRAVDEVGVPVGTRAMGGMWSVPKRYTEVPLLLDDGSVLLAWARDPIALRDALRPLLRSVSD